MQTVKLFVLCFSLFLLLTSSGQLEQSVHWKAELVKCADNEYTLQLSGIPSKNWRIYSFDNSQFNSIPLMTLQLEPSESYGLSDRIKEHGTVIQNLDPVFHRPLKWYEGSVLFTQKIKPISSEGRVKGRIIFVSTNDHEVSPPEEFTFDLKFNTKN